MLPNGRLLEQIPIIRHRILRRQSSSCLRTIVRYLAEFEWRFNNRFDLAAMIPALGRAALHTKPAPYWYLKMADYGA